jgi:hypothetical protein
MIEMGNDIIEEVQKRQLKWFGHTNRMDETRWPRKAVKWAPQEKCERGRQRRGWTEDIKEAMEGRESAVEGKSGEWGRRNGDGCEINSIYIYIIIMTP